MSPRRPKRLFWLVLVNAITGLRLLAAPLLIATAVIGDRDPAFWIIVFMFGSDVADGALARLTGQKTRFGAQLDSVADFTAYAAISVSVVLLWPDLVASEYLAFAAIVGSVLVPTMAGLLKFGWFTSYHTILTKTAVAACALALLTALWGGPNWPLRAAAALAVAAAIEEVAITLVLRRPVSNVVSLFRLLRGRRGPE